MRSALPLLLFISPALLAEVVNDGQSAMTEAERVMSKTQSVMVDEDTASGAVTSSGRVIEYGSGAKRGVVEATPHIHSADELATKQNKMPSQATSKSARQEKVEQRNSVKLITGGDPSEGSAKVGRLPVLD